MSTQEHTTVDLRLTEEKLRPAGVVLTASGELDMATTPQLRTRLRELIEAGARRLVIDLTPVAFMDSVALAAILTARRDLADVGRLAVVIAPESYPRLVFEIAGLPEFLNVFETREAAVAHVLSV
jgi:anti-sigma B factor antagonist